MVSTIPGVTLFHFTTLSFSLARESRSVNLAFVCAASLSPLLLPPLWGDYQPYQRLPTHGEWTTPFFPLPGGRSLLRTSSLFDNPLLLPSQGDPLPPPAPVSAISLLPPRASTLYLPLLPIQALRPKEKIYAQNEKASANDLPFSQTCPNWV